MCEGTLQFLYIVLAPLDLSVLFLIRLTEILIFLQDLIQQPTGESSTDILQLAPELVNLTV